MLQNSVSIIGRLHDLWVSDLIYNDNNEWEMLRFDTGDIICRGVRDELNWDVFHVQRLAVGTDCHNEDLMTSAVVSWSPRQFHRLPRQRRH